MTMCVWRGRVMTPEVLVETLIRRGFAAPGARGMKVEHVIEQIVGGGLLDAKDAPRLVQDQDAAAIARRAYNHPPQPSPVDGEYKVVNYPEGHGF